MLEDGTWKQELGEKDQIIALTTKLTEIQAKFDQQIASVVTKTKGEQEVATASTSNFNSNGNHRSKQNPYTVAAWRLIKKEDMVTVNGKEYHWCTGDHYSGSEKHNGMYADHKSSKHDAWRKNMDDICEARGSGNKPSNEAPTPVAAAPCILTYPLTKDTLRQICGVNTTFQRISCGYGILPSKICKALQANQNIQDWGTEKYFKGKTGKYHCIGVHS
jgi:hypothetical protein